MVIMKRIIYILCATVGLTAAAQQTPAPDSNKAIIIMNATAHIGNGQVIENSIILIENGKISEIADATTVNMALPDGEIIKASGMHVYPGIIACNTTLGLVEIDAVKASDDDTEIGTMNPHIRSLIAYNAESRVVETMRPNGVLIAQIVPRGGRISGQSSVVQMDAWNYEDAAVRVSDGVHINWPRTFTRSGTWYEPGPTIPSKKYEEQVTELEQFIAAAKGYTGTGKQDLKYAALKPALSGTTTVYIHVNGEKSIRDVLGFIKEHELKKVVLVGAQGAQNLTSQLVAMHIPVLAGRVHDLPARADEDYDMPYKFPKLLSDAGVMVALENSGDMERHQARNFPFYAGTIVGYGMDAEKALQLVTLNAATVLGIEKDYGSLEKGKSATLFISKGNALDMRGNQLTRAFIDGRDISLNTRQKDLSDRYMDKYNKQ